MILRKWLSVKLIMIGVVSVLRVNNVSGSSGSKSKGKGKGKRKGAGMAASASSCYSPPDLAAAVEEEEVHRSTSSRSGHQYGEGDEEVEGDDGREGEEEESGPTSTVVVMKPSKPDPHFQILDEQKAYYRRRDKSGGSNEVKPTMLTEVKSSSSQTKKACCKTGKKDKGQSHYSAAAASSFKKRSEVDRMFSGSRLISGEAGMGGGGGCKANRQIGGHVGGDVNGSGRNAGDESSGWKILMGPTVGTTPVEEEHGSRDSNYAYDQDDYSFSKRSFTALTDSSARASSNPRTITRLPQRERSGRGRSKGTPAPTTQKSSRLRQASAIIPKQTLQHKYAKVTRRQPAKCSTSVSTSNTKGDTRSGKKVSSTSSKMEYCTPIKSYHFRRDSFKPSPALTLDMKKVLLQSGEATGPFPISRFDRLAPPLLGDDDTEQGQHDDASNDVGVGFQTKTALNLGEVYSPLVSVSTSMSYPKTKKQRRGQATKTPVAVSSVQFPKLVHSPLDPPLQDEQLEELASRAASSPEENDIIDDSIVDDSDKVNDNPAYPYPPAGRSSSNSGRIMTRPHPNTISLTSPDPDGGGGGGGSGGGSSSLAVVGLPPFRRVPESIPPLPVPDNFHFAAPNAPSELFPFRQEFLDLSSGYQHDHGNSHQFLAGQHHYPHQLPQLHHPQHPPPPLPPPTHTHPQLPPQDNLPSHSNLEPQHLPLVYPHQYPLYKLIPYPPHSPTPFPFHRKPIDFLPPGIPHHGSGRKAPPNLAEQSPIGVHHQQRQEQVQQPTSPLAAPAQAPPPGVDPAHPAIQHTLRNPNALLRDGIFIEPTDSGSHIPETTKHYLQYEVHKNSLIPLDKRLVYLSMIFSWMFWITAFYTYYRYAINGHKTNHFVLNVPHGGENPQVVTARSMDVNNPWNFTKALEYIEIAQKTYEMFDRQDLECQKRTLCELVQKQQDPWGETGRKIANSYVYRVMDSLDGLPIPQVIQNYLKQYKEAISKGKNPANNCGLIYDQCKFSIKDVLIKAGKKKA